VTLGVTLSLPLTSTIDDKLSLCGSCQRDLRRGWKKTGQNLPVGKDWVKIFIVYHCIGKLWMEFYRWLQLGDRLL
jgi:hypothetical protein